MWLDGDYPYGAEKIGKLYSDGKWDPRTDEDTHDNYIFVEDSNGQQIADTPEIFEEWQNDVNLPTLDEYYARESHRAEERKDYAEGLLLIDKAIAVKPGYMYYLRKSHILLSIMIEKYTKSAPSSNLQKKGGGKISKPDELISLLESDKTAKKIVRYFGYEKGALIDVLSAYYNKEFRSRLELSDLTKNSEFQEYLTEKTKRIENLEDWRDFARNVVPQIAFLKHEYDDTPGREGRPQMRIVIENIFRDFSYKFLGAYPTYEKVEEMVNCLQDSIDEK